MNRKNTPKLRFKEFEKADPWEQRKLGDISDSYSGGTPTAGKAEYYGGNIPFIRSAEVNSDRTELFLTEEGLKNSSAKMVNKGDILYALYGATSGEVGLARLDGAINQAILDIKPHEDFDASFIMQWLRKSKASIIGTYLQGGQGNLSGAIVTSLMVDCPNYAEQQKIGGFFSELDDLITLHQRKYEKLKKVKNAYLDEMFPKNGERFPKRRFPGFTDPWEQRKLGEVSERVQGNDGRMDLPTLTISAANGWMSQEDRFSGNIAGKEQKNYTLLHKGELSYNHGNSKLAKYGTVFSLESYEEALVPRVYHSFRMIDADASFIEYYFSTKIPDRELAKLISSGARMDGLLNISFDEFMGIKINLPSIQEQQKISYYLRQLDNLITLHQRELDKLKKLKAAYLDAMFVGGK